MARSALFVSSSTYADEQLTRLPSAAADAAELGQVVADPQIGGFDVSTLTDPEAQQLREGLEDFLADAEADDLLVLYLSGHGLKDPRGSLFFAAHDTRANRLQSTAVSAYFLCSLLNDSRAGGIVVFLDCCYGGAFARGMVARSDGDPQVGDAFATLGQGARGRAVVTASSAIEYAFESEQLAESHAEPSVFASAMRDGIMHGDADRDGDGWVGLNELFDYVTQRIGRLGKPQTPHLWTFGMSGDLRLARSPRGPRASASALPPEIRELLTSPLPAVRLGAVSDLQQRGAGDDIDAARAAVAALVGLTEDDSLRVRAAVDDAVAAIAPKVEPSELSVQAPSSGVETVTARLHGPPIAQDAFVEPVAEGVSANAAGEEITVKVGPSAAPGALTLQLRWPGGVVPVALTVEESEPALLRAEAVDPTPSHTGADTAADHKSRDGVADADNQTPATAAGPAARDDTIPGRGRSEIQFERTRPQQQDSTPPDNPRWLAIAGLLWVLALVLPYNDDYGPIVAETNPWALLLLAIGLVPAGAGVYRLRVTGGRISFVIAVVTAVIMLGWSVFGGIGSASDEAPAPAFTLLVAAALTATYLIGVARRARRRKQRPTA